MTDNETGLDNLRMIFLLFVVTEKYMWTRKAYNERKSWEVKNCYSI